MQLRPEADFTTIQNPSRQRLSGTLGYALLIYMVIMVLLMTLAPFRFRIPHRFVVYFSGCWEDTACNVLLFVPLGFLCRLSRRKPGGFFGLRELVFGLLFSATIEAAQLFLPGRYTQVIDVVTNGLGTWVGAMGFTLFKVVIDRKPVPGIFSLELPLMNLVYLLVPLLWLNGLAAGPDPTRLWLQALLGGLGVAILGSIYRNRFAPARVLSPNQLAVFALVWFLVSAFPVLIMAYPVRVLAIALGLLVLARILVSFPGPAGGINRRFELSTLKRVVPIYVAYLVLLPLWPLALSLQDFQFYLDFEYFTSSERFVAIFRFVELLAALTFLGYLIAELRGRKRESLERALSWIVAISLLCLVFIHLVRQYQAPGSSRLHELLPLLAASVYGGIIYRLQLRAIRKLSLSEKRQTG